MSNPVLAGTIAARIRQAGDSADMGFVHGILRAIAAARWLMLVWAIVGAVVSRSHLTRPGTAIAMVALMGAITAGASFAVATRPTILTRLPVLVAELCAGVAGLLLDVYVYEPERVQSLVWAWPSAVILTSALVLGARVAVPAALILGLASFFGDARNSLDSWGVAASSKTALFVLAAVIASYVVRRLRVAEREVSTAKARQEVGRALHDGVLQTLAVVQRRSNDDELVALACQQDAELRDFLFGETQPDRSLATGLRDVAAIVRARDQLVIEVSAAEDLPKLHSAVVEALCGATREALTNAAKHAKASRVIVFAEPEDDGVFVSIKDDGIGFDPAETPAGTGLSQSIRARIEDIGGSVTLRSAPTGGTEVQLLVRDR